MKVTDQIKNWVKYACHCCSVPALYPSIRIEFNSRFTSRMGDASYNTKTGRGRIRLSSVLWSRAAMDEKRDTVIHETCHIIEGALYSTAGHGPRWKRLMRKCGISNPQRCHTVRVDDLQRKTTRIAMYCRCSEPHMITKHRATKMKKGKMYRCTKCSSLLLSKKRK